MRGDNPAAAQAPLQSQIEVGGIDTEEEIRWIGHEMVVDAPAYPQQLRQALQRLDEAHYRQALHRHHAAQALSLHQRPANALDYQARAAGMQGSQQPGAEYVPGGLAGEHANTH